MKFVFVLAALVACALAKPVDDVQTLKNTFEQVESNYKFEYELSDAQKIQEEGEVKNIGEEVGIVMRGSFSFVGDDGVTYTVNYIADENGFQPQGAHIP